MASRTLISPKTAFIRSIEASGLSLRQAQDEVVVLLGSFLDEAREDALR